MRRLPGRRGLSILELLIVIAIILIVAALIVTALVKLYRIVKSLGNTAALPIPAAIATGECRPNASLRTSGPTAAHSRAAPLDGRAVLTRLGWLEGARQTRAAAAGGQGLPVACRTYFFFSNVPSKFLNSLPSEVVQ